MRWGLTGPTPRLAIETRDKTGGDNGYVSCYLLFSTLLISLSRFSSFPIVYSTITGGAGRDVTGPTRAAQQRGTGQGVGGQEGEVERWAKEGSGGGQGAETGGRQKKQRGGLRQMSGGGGQASKSGRRLSNIAVVLHPPWLRDMLSTIRA